MAEVPARPFLVAGALQLSLAPIASLLLVAGSPWPAPFVDVLLAGGGLVLLAAGLLYGYAPPFLKRELLDVGPAWLALGLVLAADAASLLGAAWAGRVMGLACLVLPVHVGASAFAGKEWRGGIALFAKDQPYRRGDQVAAGAFALALVDLAGAGVLLLVQPHRLLAAGLVALVGGFALPFAAGTLVFFLPRNAKTPLPGATLVIAALGVHALATLALVVAFVRPVGADFRTPAFAMLLALALMLVALARLKFPAPGAQLQRATPFLRGGAALAVLAGLADAVALAGGAPSALLPLAAYTSVALAASLLLAATLLGAPILVNAVPREGRWGGFAVALAIASLFLVAPSYQYARSAFPGALVAALAGGLVLWGLWPMRRPRREC